MLKKSMAIMLLSISILGISGCSEKSRDTQDIEALQQFRDDESVRNPYTDEQMEQLKSELESYMSSYGEVTTNQVYFSNGAVIIQGDMDGKHYMFKGFIDSTSEGYTVSNCIRYELL